ncbi:MAG: MerR family transcriptional regulator [Anaeromicrobium sp.]|jgi:DNA-binding transcriptional MerR regulator/ubiquinone/menaquinone biosynthesis C-methylase UbiE|uniref:MerR family transcriptional regulator n=1 Tax=Anaeromicrobium sp. TaxID=1929132 RepID=UPI0025F11379|nr:MerR family transcriptional regulator [Anaeromicrobium sp.]MCT4595119.1 MerR family transcriptional regulator [Anaeromicrobium sp.]
MKIGKFAEINNISKDTIRHYMYLGLIVPEKLGGQYDFDERCKNSLNRILNLKNMGFTLNEIKIIFTFRVLGNLIPYEEEEYYKTIFMNKYENLIKDIENLTNIKNRLKKKIDEISKEKSKKKFTLGIHISTLNLLRCLKCNGELGIVDGTIKDNQIIYGKLRCNCNEEYIIEDGILRVDDYYRESELNLFSGDISEYINVTDSDYLDNVYKGIKWIDKKVDFNNVKDKVILELGSGFGFYLRNIYNKLSDNSVYIAVDYDLARHRFLKGIIERAECRKNIIFLCTDFLQIPIKSKSVDMVVDFSGTSNYNFENEEFLLEQMGKYVKDSGYLIGTYILFKNFSTNSLIEEKYRKNFVMENVKTKIYNLGYKCIDDKVSDYVEEGGKYEGFFVKGEKVYNYIFYGKR